MGEKIKDLHPIKVGSASFMIELNEGYTTEGRVIHIQNSKFRYLFKELDFLKVAANILRAKSELDYVRVNRAEKASREKSHSGTALSQELDDTALRFVDMLGSSGADFRVIEAGDGFLSVIVRNEDYNKYRKCVASSRDVTLLEHPSGKLFGYKFIYQMRPFEMLKYKSSYVEVLFQLPCMSLTPKTWMPVDRKIQSRVWESVNPESITLDGVCYLIFKICWSIFKNGYFTVQSRNVIGSLLKEVDLQTFREFAELVFFNFTDNLIAMLAQSRFDEIIPCYFEFMEY